MAMPEPISLSPVDGVLAVTTYDEWGARVGRKLVLSWRLSKTAADVAMLRNSTLFHHSKKMRLYLSIFILEWWRFPDETSEKLGR
jgi:hypothetical protein